MCFSPFLFSLILFSQFILSISPIFLRGVVLLLPLIRSKPDTQTHTEANRERERCIRTPPRRSRKPCKGASRLLPRPPMYHVREA
ncbi:hypothetical protein TRSC58_07696 [Trypanosoma rangeli SC58]|uniref:Uncharacterized protein n=1 Tax=Trypanosoma rangeli SC58 TaxID=429131 RepID=A0A061ISD7_TRYRA|nr:hypothetical protein TRSC58_07696 [Trypanosoma rangeli SC58]